MKILISKPSLILICSLFIIIFSVQSSIAEQLENSMIAINKKVPCNYIDDNLHEQYGLGKKTITSARNMLNRVFGDWRKFCKYNPIEISKRLNFLVYNYCKVPNIKQNHITRNINDAFTKCYGRCALRSDVLRGLLAVYGIHTRRENIYNIPGQGNHSAVKIIINGKPAFLDPTFGTFFADNIQFLPLSLQAAKYSLTKKNIAKYTFQAIKTNDLSKALSAKNLSAIYHKKFHAKWFDLASYLDNENVSSPHATNILFLSANLELKNNKFKLGCMNATTTQSASDCFLKQIMKLYLQKNSNYYISYVINYIGYLYSQMHIDVFNLKNLHKNSLYTMNMLINNPSGGNKILNIGTLGRNIILSAKSKKILLRPGMLKYTISFKAKQTNGSLLFYTVPRDKWLGNIFALNINLSK